MIKKIKQTIDDSEQILLLADKNKTLILAALFVVPACLISLVFLIPLFKSLKVWNFSLSPDNLLLPVVSLFVFWTPLFLSIAIYFGGGLVLTTKKVYIKKTMSSKVISIPFNKIDHIRKDVISPRGFTFVLYRIHLQDGFLIKTPINISLKSADEIDLIFHQRHISIEHHK